MYLGPDGTVKHSEEQNVLGIAPGHEVVIMIKMISKI